MDSTDYRQEIWGNSILYQIRLQGIKQFRLSMFFLLIRLIHAIRNTAVNIGIINKKIFKLQKWVICNKMKRMDRIPIKIIEKR